MEQEMEQVVEMEEAEEENVWEVEKEDGEDLGVEHSDLKVEKGDHPSLHQSSPETY